MMMRFQVSIKKVIVSLFLEEFLDSTGLSYYSQSEIIQSLIANQTPIFSSEPGRTFDFFWVENGILYYTANLGDKTAGAIRLDKMKRIWDKKLPIKKYFFG